MSRRDEFTAQTKRILAARAGHRCSFPGCLQVTSGPSADGPDKHVNLGEACHIRGAKKGSKRYDPSMSPEQRSDFTNGIWMCGKHHHLIDSDEATYTVEQLEQWKKDAEQRAERWLRGGSVDALRASRI